MLQQNLILTCQYMNTYVFVGESHYRQVGMYVLGHFCSRLILMYEKQYAHTCEIAEGGPTAQVIGGDVRDFWRQASQ